MNSYVQIEAERATAALFVSGSEGDTEVIPTNAGVLRVFSHEMLSAVSFHLFAKRPIMPLTTFGELKTSLATRVALAALQVRLNVLSRKEPLFG